MSVRLRAEDFANTTVTVRVGTLGDRAERFDVFHREGFGVLVLSWRGYGGSTGSPSEPGFVEDGRAGGHVTARTADIQSRFRSARQMNHVPVSPGPDAGDEPPVDAEELGLMKRSILTVLRGRDEVHEGNVQPAAGQQE